MSQQTAVRSGATSCYLSIRQIRSVTLSFLYCNCMYNVHKCTSRTLSYHNSGLRVGLFTECTNLNLIGYVLYSEVLCAESQERTHHWWSILAVPQSQLPGRDDDLRLLCRSSTIMKVVFVLTIWRGWHVYVDSLYHTYTEILYTIRFHQLIYTKTLSAWRLAFALVLYFYEFIKKYLCPKRIRYR